MEASTIIGAVAAAAGAGLGLGVAMRMTSLAVEARRSLRNWSNGPQGSEPQRNNELTKAQRKLANPEGRSRNSSIVGIYQDVLRHTNGDYTRLYHLPLQATMLCDDQLTDSYCDELAGLLTAELPAGTLIQFRYAVAPDPGRSIAEHLRARDFSRTYAPAARLHDLNVDFYKNLADGRLFRREQAIVSIRVPVKQTGDDTSKGLSAFIPEVAAEVRKQGFSHLTDALSSSWGRTKDDGVVRRILEAERAAFEKAEKVFRIAEMRVPAATPLRRLTLDELWEVLYKGHVLTAGSVPAPPHRSGYDLRDYLCAENIEDRGWYVMHGSVPVSIISMFTPAQPQVYSDVTRALTAHPGLTFRHTVVTEFVYLDRRKSIKQLDRRIRQVRRTNTRADGRHHMTPEARAALSDLENVRDHITGSREALVQMRFYIIVYADPSRNRGELRDSLKRLDEHCDMVVSAIQSIDGAEAAREEPASLHCLYPKALVGEADNRPTGREITEVAHSLAPFVPTETAWQGSARPHTLFSTVSGRLTGLNLWDKSSRSKIKSPLVLILSEPGGGKSTSAARIINDALASVSDVRVHAVDVGGSLAPHADVVGARYLRFNPEDPRTINIWDYPELAEGQMAGDEHVSLIVMDALTLANVRPDDDESPDILAKAVTQVLKNFVPRNGSGRPRCEPTHSHLISMLESYDFGHQELNRRAVSLGLKLEKYVGNAWLDQPTHPDFHVERPYDVYELDSLDTFPADIRNSLANRVAARVIRSIGKLQPDGTRTPTLLVFDECHKYPPQYPGIMGVIKKGARQGRKENVVTMLLTQTYDDFTGIHDVTKTTGVKIIGKQTGDFSRLVRDANLSPRAVAAIQSIKNVDGIHAQYVCVLGSGHDQQVEMLQVDLSPTELWTFTTNPDERNARARVAALRPEWSLADVIAWLAQAYPRGLASQGIIEIDERLLPV